MNYSCILCFTKSVNKVLNKNNVSKENRKRFEDEYLAYLDTIADDNSMPEVMREVQEKLKKILNTKDIYKDEKDATNSHMLSLYPTLKEIVENSDNKYLTALKISTAGNIIDFGPDIEINIEKTIDGVLKSDYAVDESDDLKVAIQNAERILYLGDNSGEIVADKLFIETLGKPVVFAVKDGPILNDVTVEDAKLVKMDEVATVISNGDNTPSTIIERTSKEFKDIFNTADLIISKGQGNFEGLCRRNDPRIFFNLMVKCDVVANMFNTVKGEYILSRYVQ